MTSLLIGSFVLALSLSAFEFVTVLRARLLRKTQNTRRVAVRGMIFVFLMFLLWQYREWQDYIANFTYFQLNDVRVNNTPFLLAVMVVGLTLLLLMFEMTRHYRAKKAGLTRNKSRLVTGLLILLCLFPILKATTDMWDVYVEKIAASRPPMPSAVVP